MGIVPGVTGRNTEVNADVQICIGDGFLNCRPQRADAIASGGFADAIADRGISGIASAVNRETTPALSREDAGYGLVSKSRASLRRAMTGFILHMSGAVLLNGIRSRQAQSGDGGTGARTC